MNAYCGFHLAVAASIYLTYCNIFSHTNEYVTQSVGLYQMTPIIDIFLFSHFFGCFSTLLKFAPAFVLGRLHHVETTVLLHQLLPLPCLDQTVNHSSQRVPVHTETPPTATLHETGALLPAADEKRADLIEQHENPPTKNDC